MMNALLVLALVCQDADVAVTGHGRRTGGEYELTVSGRGKCLKEQEIVSLRFRRVVNRVNWDDGALVTVPVDHETGRVAYVEKSAFLHRERFAVAGEVEVRIGRPHSDGAPPEDRQIHRTFRVSSFPEEAHAIGSATKRFDSALRGMRLMMNDLAMMKDELCPAARKQTKLQKRIDWRMNAYRQEISDSFLSASTHALSLLMADVENAQELERTGKDATTMVSSLTGKLFSWEEVREQFDAIEAVSLRERGLLIVRAAGAMAAEIAAAVRSGEAGAWARVEKEVTRTIDALRDNDQSTQTGPMSERYASLVEVDGAGVGALLAQLREYVQAGAECVHCAKTDDPCFADLGQALTDRVAAFEQRIRTSK